MGRSVSTPSNTAMVAFDHIEYEDEYDDWSYDDFVEDLIYRAKAAWPSLTEDSGWAGREDRILLSNNLVNFGVSEYCGLVAIWVQVRGDIDHEALAYRWCRQIEPDFDKMFGELKLLGRASNGEAFFEKRR